MKKTVAILCLGLVVLSMFGAGVTFLGGDKDVVSIPSYGHAAQSVGQQANFVQCDPSDPFCDD